MPETQKFVETKDWKCLLAYLNNKHFTDLDTKQYPISEVLKQTESILEKSKIEKLEDFIKEYNLVERIKTDKRLQHESAILILFLVRYRKNGLMSVWDFDREILKASFLCLGISTEGFPSLLAN
tara:strand:+ start:7945 stop:8316 length:372 start_codon:yes stop_codon:yes gene_type:complete